MAQRDVPLAAGDRTAVLRFSCASVALLDPEGALDFGALVEATKRLPGLKRAVWAGVEGHRQKYRPDEPPVPEAAGEALVDDAGVRPAADAVFAALLAYFNPSAEWPPKGPEGVEGPKA